MSENSTPESTEGGRWWARPPFVISAVLVAFGVILLVVVLLLPGGDDDTEAQPTAAPTEAPADSGGDADSDSVCGLDSSNDTSVDEAPEADWGQAVGGISIPVSEDYGPGVEDESNGVRSCFAHSPEGAVLAATHLLTASGNPETMEATIEQRSVDNTGKGIALEQARQSAGGSGPPIQVAGFRLLSYTEDAATVEVVVRVDTSDGDVLMTTGLDLVWTDGDWYARYNDDGTGGPVSGEVSNLNGYTEWGPSDG